MNLTTFAALFNVAKACGKSSNKSATGRAEKGGTCLLAPAVLNMLRRHPALPGAEIRALGIKRPPNALVHIIMYQ